jgi:hypothetical protein
MDKLFFFFSFFCLTILPSRADQAIDDLATRLTSKWTQEMVGAKTGGAILKTTNVDPLTGQITAKSVPPSGPAGDNEIFGLWPNVWANSAYDWNHIMSGQDIWTKNP